MYVHVIKPLTLVFGLYMFKNVGVFGPEINDQLTVPTNMLLAFREVVSKPQTTISFPAKGAVGGLVTKILTVSDFDV